MASIRQLCRELSRAARNYAGCVDHPAECDSDADGRSRRTHPHAEFAAAQSLCAGGDRGSGATHQLDRCEQRGITDASTSGAPLHEILGRAFDMPELQNPVCRQRERAQSVGETHVTKRTELVVGTDRLAATEADGASYSDRAPEELV